MRAQAEHRKTGLDVEEQTHRGRKKLTSTKMKQGRMEKLRMGVVVVVAISSPWLETLLSQLSSSQAE
ncbi:unnamed protein product [Boreogadus saida]